MTTVLTICSANYLAHARVLGDSLHEFNPDIHFVIGLVDRLPEEIDFTPWQDLEILPIEDLAIARFAEMEKKYDVVELNTAVKPFYMEHLYNRHSSLENVIYLDPDILVKGSLNSLLEKLQKFDIVVTPHSCTYDNSSTNIHYEIAMLATGIYNLGFVATTRCPTVLKFLKWWQRRLEDHCYYRGSGGLFVDQIWVTLAPVYFPGIHIELNPGYNMAYWNHFERRLKKRDDIFLVNESDLLVFHHFSSYNPMVPGAITGRSSQPTMTFGDRGDLLPLFDEYRTRLMEAGFVTFNTLECKFGRSRNPKKKEARTSKLALQKGMKLLLIAVPGCLRSPLKRIARFVSDNTPV
jgi:hypothetical protein